MPTKEEYRDKDGNLIKDVLIGREQIKEKELKKLACIDGG